MLARLPTDRQRQIEERVTRAFRGEVALQAPPPTKASADEFQVRCGKYRAALRKCGETAFEVIAVYIRGASPLSSREF